MKSKEQTAPSSGDSSSSTTCSVCHRTTTGCHREWITQHIHEWLCPTCTKIITTDKADARTDVTATVRGAFQGPNCAKFWRPPQ